MTTDKPKRKWWKWAAVAGAALGAACHVMPAHYRAPCEVASHIITICTGGS